MQQLYFRRYGTERTECILGRDFIRAWPHSTHIGNDKGDRSSRDNGVLLLPVEEPLSTYLRHLLYRDFRSRSQTKTKIEHVSFRLWCHRIASRFDKAYLEHHEERAERPHEFIEEMSSRGSVLIVYQKPEAPECGILYKSSNSPLLPSESRNSISFHDRPPVDS